jgi:hypothetical protein
MAKRYEKAFSVAELAELPDAAIDRCDIAEINSSFWLQAELIVPNAVNLVTKQVRASLDWQFASTIGLKR